MEHQKFKAMIKKAQQKVRNLNSAEATASF